jgi:hypothetical protein
VATKLTGRLTGGTARWFSEMADGSLTIGDTQFGMMPSGTYSAADQPWLWAWANEAFPPVAKESAATCETAGNVFTGQHR